MLIAFFWFFTEIIIYLIVASIVGVAAQPFMKLLGKIKIKERSLPRSISASVTLILFISIFGGLLAVLIPAVNSQANDLTKVDYTLVADNLGSTLNTVETTLKEIGVLNKYDDIETEITHQLTVLVQDIQVENIFQKLISMTGSIFMGVFSILFMSFFFIKDEELFQGIVMLFVSEKNHHSTECILLKIKKMLSRYFLGIIIEVSTMMFLITIGGLFLGLKNALLIGFIGGLMNVIPYLGPIIGASIGSILIAMTNIYLGMDHTLALIGGILAVFAIANMLDNFFLQPIIYSTSVNAHPLEIFIVIIMAGTLGGALGMIAAIPIYTVLRITAKELIGDRIFVKKLTQNV